MVAILDSLARASLTPASLRVVHELLFLSNVLAPVFDLEPGSASILKRRGGPYYPAMQRALDQLVGSGVVVASGISFVKIPEEGRYALEANYALNYELASPIVDMYRRVYHDTGTVDFIDELAVAYSTLATENLGSVSLQDARYAHDDVDVNNVIDFGEWTKPKKSNFSRNAAMSFSSEVDLQPAERIYLYLEHLSRRAHHG